MDYCGFVSHVQVDWRGYDGPDGITWEPVSNLLHMDVASQYFEQREEAMLTTTHVAQIECMCAISGTHVSSTHARSQTSAASLERNRTSSCTPASARTCGWNANWKGGSEEGRKGRGTVITAPWKSPTQRRGERTMTMPDAADCDILCFLCELLVLLNHARR